MTWDDLHTIVYMSACEVPPAQDELIDLLQRARSNNRRLDITGLLLYRNQRFIQILEGPRQSVETIYAVIRMDPMHDSVTTLVNLPAERRMFLEWSMAFAEISDEMADTVPGFSFFMKKTYPQSVGSEPTNVLAMLENFRGMLN